MPKVSVIVPIYKVEKYLVQCIDSIVNQTLKDIEIILVDEGDMDACRFIIDHYEQADNRVKTIHEKNGGYGASVNKGFDIAAGEYLSIIESDDFIAPTMYEEMYNYAKKLDADVVKTPYYEYWDKSKDNDEKIQLCFWHAKTKDVPENKLFSIEEQSILAAIHPSIWSGLYKNEYIKNKNIRCIEAKGAGYVDNHFRLQTLCQTNKIAFLNKAFNYYRLSNPDASQANYDLHAFIQRWSDVHKMFAEKFSEKWNVLAPFCFKEECVNTFEKLFDGYSLSKEDATLLKENLSYTSLEQMKRAENIYEKKLKKIVRLKENPKLIDNYIRKEEDKKRAEKMFSLLGLIPIFTIKKVKSKTEWVKFLGIFPFLKIKTRNLRLKEFYLFGLIFIADIKKRIPD